MLQVIFKHYYFCCDGKDYTLFKVYDNNRDSWVARTSLSIGRGHLGMAALHGSLYAVGGVGCVGGTSQVLASCEKFDPGSDEWVPIGE